MDRIARALLIIRLALRSIWSHKVKSLIVGSLMFFGTFLVVLGTALLDSVESAMERTIVSSLAGHLQAYDAEARDPLALFGGAFMGSEDIGQIREFAPVKEALTAVDGVEAVVPMGLATATVSRPGELDRALESLREAVRSGDTGAVPLLAGQIRQIAEEMKPEVERERALSSDTEKIEKSLEILDRVASDAFWAELDTDPMPTLEFLDTQLAPLSDNAAMLFLRLLGTDLSAFVENFDRFQLVDGELPPRGRRGLVVSKRWYEQQAKHRVAREIDRLYKGVTEGGVTIADDAVLSDRAKRLPGQYQRITFELSVPATLQLEKVLSEAFPEVEGGLKERLQHFLTIDDSNIRQRRDFFYEKIAPLIQLYAVGVGEVLTLRSYTRSGYLKAVNVPVWGVFEFSGLESSDLAGAQNLVDMITFREVYGVMTERKRAELAAIKEEVGIEDVARDDAEAALFGDTEVVEEAAEIATGFDEFEGDVLAHLTEESVGIDEHAYSQDEIDGGLALSAAIILSRPEEMRATWKRLEKKVETAGLGVQLVDWQTAAGLVGQFIWVIRAVLYVAIVIIFVVALFIINNSMVIATMERVAEIGTMRAIGAQRAFVMTMFLMETVVLGFLSGGLGAAAGAGLVTSLGKTGIPAGTTDILIFLFSGPRLYPTVGAWQLVLGVVVIVLVSVISTLYPALLAIRVPPVVAMQSGE